MSAIDYSTEAGAAFLNLIESFSSSLDPADEKNAETFGSGSGSEDNGASTMDILGGGHDIRCDFRKHSTSSDQSSVSASPGVTGASVVQSRTAAAGASSPSGMSSDPESVSAGRASPKSNYSAAIHPLQAPIGAVISSSPSLADFSGGRGSELGGPLIGSGTLDCSYCHQPYRQPRLLRCLHSYCEDCIVAMLEGRYDDMPRHELDVELEPTKAVATKPPPGVVRCPVCKQDSNVGNDLRFVQLLPLDFVTINMQETQAMEKAHLACESCKTKDKAIARCFDCSNFLCANCVSAHQYMRCFENHKVRTFEQIKEAGEDLHIHKPIMCLEHPSEHVRCYCTSCNVPVCNECMLLSHKPPDHQHEKVSPEVEIRLRTELEHFIKDGQLKVQSCEGATEELHKRTSAVQERAELARQAVENAYTAYLEVLERRKEELFQEIDSELRRVDEEIANTYLRVGNTSEKISDALEFTQRLLRYGNPMEIMYTKKVVREQLTCLIRSVPSSNVAINLRFITDSHQFEQAIRNSFGFIRTEVEPAPISHVNVDELLKRINYMNLPPQKMPGEERFASTVPPQAPLQLDMSSVGPRVVPQPPDDSSAFTNYARIVANAVVGQGDYFGHSNGHRVSGIGGSNSSASVSPTSQTAGPRPTSCLPFNLPNSIVSGLSPADGSNHFGNALINGSLGNFTNTSRGLLPNVTLPPPSSVSSGSRRTPPGPFDVNAMGLSSAFDSSSSQGSVIGSSTGLTPPIRKAQMTQMQAKSRFGVLGPAQGQFNSPHGFCLNDKEEVAIADTNNHRVQVFSLNGEFRCQFGIPGKDEGQLWYPRKVAFLRPNSLSPGRYIVCDRGTERSRMQIFSNSGHFMKKIAIRYIDIVAGLAIDQENRIVAVDSVTPTVFCIHESGELVRWFDCAEYMREPSDIAVSGHEYYICDFKGHCVCVFSETGTFLRRVGCEGITNYPNGIDISDAGDVLIGDSHGNRFHVAVFRKSGELTCEFDCPYAKVSRCCGLRITREGFIVTIAKNNHNVLVLNTLFVNSNFPGI